ncbi:Leucine-, isoleucine-, valine-, threonine-, and alanine-binding protein precursor [compost metagenome]
MKTSSFIFPLLIAAATPLLQAQEVQTVKIGLAAPLTGPQAFYGKDSQNGARLAVDELNEKKIIVAGKQLRFELLSEDDAADPKQGAAVAQRFCDLHVHAVIGHTNSGTTIPAARIYHQCGLPNLTPSATSPEITKFGYNTTFRMLANDTTLAQAIAAYAVNVLKLKSVAVIDDRSAYGQGLADAFRAALRNTAVTVVSQQYTNDKAVDFSAILTAVKARNPDGIFFGGMDPQGSAMLRQMEQLGLTRQKFLGGDGICTQGLETRSEGLKTLNNVVCAHSGIALDRTPASRAWKQRYDAQFPGQFQMHGPYSYDAVLAVAKAMQSANSIEPQKYLPAMSKVHFAGVMSNIQFDQKGEVKNPTISIYTYQDGKRRLAN